MTAMIQGECCTRAENGNTAFCVIRRRNGAIFWVSLMSPLSRC